MPANTYEHASYKKRCYVQALRFSAGWTFRKIAEYQGLSPSTVYEICNAPATPKRGHRPFSIDTPTRRRLVATATSSAVHRRMPLHEIAAACGVHACEKTLRKASRRIAQKKPFLDTRQRQLRLDFALAHRGWRLEDWCRVIWTDECYAWLTGTRSRTWVTQRPGEEYQDDCLVPKFAKKNSVMVWGGILGGKKTPLVLWDKENWGNITSESYIQNVFTPVLLPFWYRESLVAGQL